MAERILYLTSQFPFGRAEAFLAAEVQALLELGADVTVAAVRPQRRRAQIRTGARMLALRTLSGGSLRDALQTLVRHPRKSADITFAMCRARYRPAAKIKNVAMLWKGLALAEYVRRERVTRLHAHWLTTPSTVAYVAAHIADVKWSISAHNFDLFADNWIAGKVAAASAVRVISERGARELRELLPPHVRNRIHVIHLGVSTPPVRTADAKRSAGRLRVCAVGSLTPFKGHRYLIDAIACLRNADVALSCSIAGDGPLRDELQAQIDRLGLRDTIDLRGFVAHERLVTEFGSGAFDVMVHPSTEHGRVHEGIPVSLMEAMAYGIPCVTTRTGSIPELVDRSNGIVVEQCDAGALAQAIHILAGDCGLRDRLGAAARERIGSLFNARTTAAALLQLIADAPADARVPAII